MAQLTSKYSQEKFESCLNTFREIYSEPAVDGFKGSVLLPLDFSLEMDGISGIIPNSAFEIPTNCLPKTYLTKKGESRIAFILHSIDQNFNDNKWTTKITGQTLVIRYDELTEEQKAKVKTVQDNLKKKAQKLGSTPPSSGRGYDYINQKYGEIGDQSNLTRLTFPYPMYFDGKLVKTTQVHKLVQKQLTDIFNDILTTFGLEKIKKLGLDQFSGLYNVRNKRGGSTPSIHSWGIAIDLYAAKNGLNQKTGNALFSKDEYKSFIDIWYKYGFKSFGRELGYDWMHFQVNDVIF
jgi:hypothetical protein